MVILGYGTTTFSYLIDPLPAITERSTKEGINIVSVCSEETKTYDDKIRTFTVGEEKITEADSVANDENIVLFIVFIMADSGEQYITLEKSVGVNLLIQTIFVQ